MAKEENLEFMGKIIEILPGALFRIQLINKDTKEEIVGKEVIATIAGKMRQHHIKLLLSDLIDIEVSPYDLSRGRIVYRYK